MNGKEIITRAIEFKTPERLPMLFEGFGMNDTHLVGWNQINSHVLANLEVKENYDDWGCLWSRSDIGTMGLVKGYPLEDWSNLENYNWPDANDPKFYEGMEDKFKGAEGKYVMFDIFMLLFERMQSLRGFENLMMDFYIEREKVEMLADKIVDFDITVMKNIASRFHNKIDGFHFGDDWGTQEALFINPQLWCEFFKPRYKKIFDVAREFGWHIWMHSCGKVNEIIPDLIELGVNVLNLEQPRTLGIEEIGSKFAGKVCFSSGCDIQNTLPHKDKDEIREEAKLLLDCWGTKEGGFILTDDGNDADLRTPIFKKKISLEAFLEYDPWKDSK